MLISGVWHACDDGVLRPVIAAEVQAQDGLWIKTPFLVDSGADRTVLSADILTALRFPHALAEDRIGGIGGEVSTVLVDTRIRFSREDEGNGKSGSSLAKLQVMQVSRLVFSPPTQGDVRHGTAPDENR